MKLSIKFFLAFLLTSLTIVVLMIVIMQICAYRNFSEYVGNIETTRLDELADILSDEYRIEEGWETLREDPARWGYILRPRHPGQGIRPGMSRETNLYPPESPPDELPPDELPPDDPAEGIGTADGKKMREERGRPYPGRRPPEGEMFGEGRMRRPPVPGEHGDGFPGMRRRPPPPQWERGGAGRNEGFPLPGEVRGGARAMDRRPLPPHRARPGAGGSAPLPGNGRFDESRAGLHPLPRERRGAGDDRGTRAPARGENRRQRPFGIEHRLTLFDHEKKPVRGSAVSVDEHILKEIRAGDEIVGWLGLRKEERLTQPLDLAYLKQQSQAFYITGALMLALAGVVAFLFGRHLLAPVKQLTQGTRALTNRKLDTRIHVHTRDELGQLGADFNQMAETLENYERLRQQWVSDIAHELRTPISILQGEIEALQDGIREADHRSLDSLHGEILHLGKIVRDLHDLSMAESGALQCKREPVKVGRVLRETRRMFENRYEKRNISISDELGIVDEITVQGDGDRLRQLFTNLFENTLRYTDPPGSLCLRMQCSRSHVVLLFEDSTPGVPDEALARLFDRLFRVDVSRSRAQGGSGLGLSIVKTIAQAHGGDIRAQHSSLGGVRMELTLPLSAGL